MDQVEDAMWQIHMLEVGIHRLFEDPASGNSFVPCDWIYHVRLMHFSCYFVGLMHSPLLFGLFIGMVHTLKFITNAMHEVTSNGKITTHKRELIPTTRSHTSMLPDLVRETKIKNK
jgi:hypothetical protein